MSRLQSRIELSVFNKKLSFFENHFEIGENKKIVPRHCHKEAAYQISLTYDKYFLSYEESKFSGEEREAEAEALYRSEIGDFVQVIKTEPRRISACGFQHRVP